jgi:hypothetical protein
MLATASVALNAEHVVKKIVIGDTEVTVVENYKGSASLLRPTQAIVYDFDVPSDVITLDRSAAQYLRDHGLIAHIKGDVGRNSTRDSVAAAVKAEFSKTLVKELNKAAIATSVSAPGKDAPVNALIVHGRFTMVKLGNKTQRMMIGFGLGASDVKAHVAISQATQHGRVVLATFNLHFSSNKMPGALVSTPSGMGVSVATSVATDHGETVEKDTTHMAKAVAKQIEDIMRTQKWSDPAPAVQEADQVSPEKKDHE